VTSEAGFRRYRFVDTPSFRKGVKRYASLRAQIAAKVNRILDDPYNSEPLGRRGKYDLRGKRSVRVTRNFRIVFAICEECITCGFKRKGYNACKGCTKETPDDVVVLLTVAPHNEAYGRPWTEPVLLQDQD